MSALHFTGQKQLSATLLVMAAALVSLLIYEGQQGVALRDSVLALNTRQAATPPALNLQAPFQLRPLASYAQITEQPLFVSSRTPAESKVAAAAPPPESFQLTGIAQSAQESVVLLRNTKTGKTERLKTGEKAKDGLALDSVKSNGATLDQNGQKVTLDLDVALSGNRVATPPLPPRPTSTGSAAKAAVTPPQNSARASAGPAQPAVDPGLEQLNLQRAKMGLAPCTPDGKCPP
ncbi:MAG: hypothetical protein RBR52_08145 [Thiomonas sp.]|uniref:hypothetical protein n=1 Tax=Thiomonas sp. TaxID=2047785 RepID=UPI002A365154|nr:hypothetical protein [Thiomonas sp.]MDY0330452.1 hypothetical protein [Thiomonas sp.]